MRKPKGLTRIRVREDDRGLAENWYKMMTIQGPTALDEILGRWTVYDYNDQPKPTLKLYVKNGRRPTVTITRNQQGTLRLTGDPDIVQALAQDPHNTWNRQLREYFFKEATTQFLLWTARTNPAATASLIESKWGSHTDTHGVVRNAVDRALSSAKENGQDTDPASASRNIKRIFSNNFLDQNTEHLRKLYLQPVSGATNPPNWVSDYNQVVINSRTFQRMHQDSPKILTAYCALFPDVPHRIGTPENATRRVRETLNLTPAGWRLFHRVGLPRMQPDWLNLDELRTSYRALAEANVPGAPPGALAMVINRPRNNRAFSTAQWQCGNPWKTWVQILNATLIHATTHPEQHHNVEQPPDHQIRAGLQLTAIADALASHINNNMPWGPGNYETLLARTERWETDQNALRNLAKRHTLEQDAWTSNLPETQVQGLTAVPATNAWQLAELGRQMNNCLGTLAHSCRAGTTRVFTLRQPDDPTPQTAVELLNQDGHWHPGQVEGQRHTAPIPRHQAAAQELADLYNQAWQTPAGTDSDAHPQGM